MPRTDPTTAGEDARAPRRKRSTGPSESPGNYVYLVRCRDGSLYCGWTTDPHLRVATHNRGRGAAYTRSRLPVALVWCEACTDRSAALRREIAIKRLTRTQKLALVRSATPPTALPAKRSARR